QISATLEALENHHRVFQIPDSQTPSTPEYPHTPVQHRLSRIALQTNLLPHENQPPSPSPRLREYKAALQISASRKSPTPGKLCNQDPRDHHQPRTPHYHLALITYAENDNQKFHTC